MPAPLGYENFDGVGVGVRSFVFLDELVSDHRSLGIRFSVLGLDSCCLGLISKNIGMPMLLWR